MGIAVVDMETTLAYLLLLLINFNCKKIYTNNLLVI